MPETAEQKPWEGWAILELMGHVRLAGKVSEEEHFGAKLGRIEIPGPDGTFTTQFFGGSAVYRLTPTTEGIARSVAKNSAPEPVRPWELPREPKLIPSRPAEDDGPDCVPDDEDDRPF